MNRLYYLLVRADSNLALGYCERVEEPPTIEVRALHDMDDLVRCSAIEEAVWGQGIVPTHMLRAVSSMGGLAVGAFAGKEMVGFAFGFLGRLERADRQQLLHHSHVLAVLPDWRGHGVGAAIKQEQARLCREQGLELMTWTFDPLRARNAHLNLERLGAVVRKYQPDYYGVMTDAQNGQLASDRLLAEWWLLGGQARFSGDPRSLPAVLATLGDGPGEPVLNLDAQAVHVAIPGELDGMLRAAPELAVQWRATVRMTMSHYLERGYRATRFLAGGYVLELP